MLLEKCTSPYFHSDSYMASFMERGEFVSRKSDFRLPPWGVFCFVLFVLANAVADALKSESIRTPDERCTYARVIGKTL